MASEVVCRNPSFPIPIEMEIDSSKPQIRDDDLFTAAGSGDTSLFRSSSQVQLFRALSLFATGTAALSSTFPHPSAASTFLAEADSSRSLVNNNGWAPIHISCCRGYLDIVEILIRHGANVNLKNGTCDTPLQSPPSCVLRTAGGGPVFDSTWCRDVGCILLHRAVSGGKLNVCELLISKEAEIDAADRVGQTPLTQAVICNHKELLTGYESSVVSMCKPYSNFINHPTALRTLDF